MKNDRSGFWKGPRRGSTKSEHSKDSVISLRKSGSTIARNQSEEYVGLSSHVQFSCLLTELVVMIAS